MLNLIIEVYLIFIFIKNPTMKTTLLFLSLIITSSILGQYTQIPDPNFEEALIDQGWDDKKDGKVLTKNIAEVRQLWLLNMEAQRGWGLRI